MLMPERDWNPSTSGLSVELLLRIIDVTLDNVISDV